MTAGAAVTIESISTHLQRIGYRSGLLKRDYRFSDKTVPLVGFADQTFDARSACIAVIDCPSSNQIGLESQAQDYQALGTPIVFVCRGAELQWLCVTTSGVQCQEKVPSKNLANFFEEHKDDFSPQSIYRAKTLARLDPGQHQLHFVDVGLMPLLENNMGEELAGLIKRMIESLHDSLGKPKIDNKKGKWLFQSAFWLLAARILKDKEVKGFLNIDFNEAVEVMQRVHRHYHAEHPLDSYSRRQLKALGCAADIVRDFGSLRNLTIESLAYVYENTLINKDVRKALGIHATPSYLVDYIVWQLSGWISEIPQEERYVLEPTCGHAPFLVSAARLLREMTDIDNNRELHKYLKNHLVGIEVEDFAREISRLSLTLADVPNPNGWKLKSADVFSGKTLQGIAEKSMILLCNPPFEEFTPKEQSYYKKNNVSLKSYNKSAEVLWRTLFFMPVGSVFGVILPQGLLHSSKQGNPELRQLMLEQFDIEQICTLPENVFASARHKSVVILGRKRKSRVKTFLSAPKIRYQQIQKWDLPNFIERYEAPTEKIEPARFHAAPNYDLRWQQLREVWDYCQRFPRLNDVADAGQGLVYEGRDLPPNSETILKHRFKGSVRGYAKFDTGLKLTETPSLWFMNLSEPVIRRPQWGVQTGKPQVLLNYARVSDDPWRLKALIDKEGHPVTSNFLVIRPTDISGPLEIFWALINSPFANAYAYCHSLERHNLAGMVRKLPLPECDFNSLKYLNQLVNDYFDLYASSGEILQADVNSDEAQKRMWAIDAEVMRMYNLPPRLERQVLDLFNGWTRKGVDFEQKRYYPEDFDSWIPLHEYLSEEFQRSTVSFVKDWVEKVRSPEIIKALETAVEAFSEED